MTSVELQKILTVVFVERELRSIRCVGLAEIAKRFHDYVYTAGVINSNH